jgi:DMSO reductase family type II enzyme heme b subunit
MAINPFHIKPAPGRISRGVRVLVLSVTVLSLSFSVTMAEEPAAQAPAAASPEIEAGKKIYQKWCINCHGEEGDGAGPAADFLRPRPRDFRTGLFKIRSTVSGQLPSDQDLFHVITKGMPGTGMPSWEHALKEPDRRQLVPYIKTFSRRFARTKDAPKPVEIGKRIASGADSIAKGKQLFHDMECFKCHGEDGRADGPSAPELTDDWNYPIRPANLTQPWNFRGGHAPNDLYLRFQSGISGTPMPSFADSLDNDKTWNLVNYVMSLWPDPSGNVPPLKVVLRARRVESEIPAKPGDPFWLAQEAFDFPLVGQVIKEPRMFTPTGNEIEVKAVYNDREVAFHLTWDDPTNSRPDSSKGIFEDAVAVQLPVQIPTGTKRPFFLMGDPELAVQLLRWSDVGESADGTVTEMNGNGIARLAAQPSTSQETKGVGEFKNGRYRVVLKRPLRTGNTAQDIQLEPGKFIPIAFFAWDGSNGETGAKMAISHWYYFLMEPPLPKTVFIYPVIGVVVAAGLQWWMIRRLRQRS